MSQNKQTQYDYSTDAEWEYGAKVETEPLIELLEAAHELVDECVLHIDEERVWLSAVDPAKVAMIEASTECVVHADGETAFGVGMEEFLEQLDKFESHDKKARLWLSPKSRVIDIRNDYNNREVMVFSPASVRDEPEPPELEYPNSVTMDSFRFVGAIEGVTRVADGPVLIEPGDGFVRFAASPSYVDQKWSHKWDVDADASEGPEGVFTPGFLKSIGRGLPASGSVKIEFGGQIPMRIDNGEGYRYMIAPRIGDYPERSEK